MNGHVGFNVPPGHAQSEDIVLKNGSHVEKL